VNILEDRV